ncbi:MAG: glutamine--fructose-6-phosphate transaminase (isomerizing) [Candidatus Diapherotrites archaeon]|nr:glutamine--fructose-6-phosphate transaminase (isomerizing) [Candidatus Diapherotrites archaeon]
MCGIVGVIGKSAAPQKAFSCLKNLEYRGYDSWGIAFKSCNGIESFKQVGPITQAPKGFLNHNSYASVCHTRWATHGHVCEENAHPIFSQSRKLCIVHNGIIENFEELKALLEKRGFVFRTETDTEVLANMIEFELNQGEKSFPNAVRSALSQITGCYAVVAMHSDFFELVCAKNMLPLVIGVGKDAFFAASDVTAFFSSTKKVVFLEDSELAVLGREVELFSIASREKVKRDAVELDWSFEQAKKGNYPDFMLKEIFEQPQTIRNAFSRPVSEIEKASEMIKKAHGVFFVGCGSSFHACVNAQYFFSKNAHMHVNAVLASEFSNFENFIVPETLVVAVSQSGETADVIDAVKTAKKKGAKVLSIVNTMGSTLWRLSDMSLLMNAGPEICVLSTKTYTSQVSLLLLLSFFAAGEKNEGLSMLEKTAGLSKKVLEDSSKKAIELAKRLSSQKSIFVIGRNSAFPAALEGALKIKEVSYIHAEGFAGGELKHGTIALIEKGTPVIAIATADTRPMILSNAQEVRARGAFVIGVDSKKNSVFDEWFELPPDADSNPVLMIMPLQLLAYNLAIERGLDPEKPRNLAKSVTVK